MLCCVHVWGQMPPEMLHEAGRCRMQKYIYIIIINMYCKAARGLGKERRYPLGRGERCLIFVMAGVRQLCPEMPDFCWHTDEA